MIKRSGPFATIWAVFFGGVFALAGAGALYSSLRKTGDGGGLVVGPIILGIGVWQIVRAIRDTRSAESLAPRGGSASLADVVPPLVLDYRSPAARPRSAAELYAPLLESAPLPRITTEPGQVLARALPRPSAKEGLGLAVFAMIWNLFTLPFLGVAVFAGSVGIGLFMVPFVGVGILVATLAGKKLLSRAKLPRVEVSEEPAFVGDEIRIHVEQHGPARVNRLQVDLLCRESVKYTVGTDTRTEDNDLFTRPLVDEGARTLARGERWPHQLSAILPANLPPSFASKNNAVRWLVRVRADIAGWPDYDELFELRALPKVGR